LSDSLTLSLIHKLFFKLFFKCLGVAEAEEEQEPADPILLSVFSHRFMGIAEQMGRTLQRTSMSVNIKERLDFSCALFAQDGGLISNAPHIPVHLGAMQEAVKAQINYWNMPGRPGIQDGDVLVSNHVGLLVFLFLAW
jgi:5-oxoprolinase (ATP-hydrolysing)